MSFRTWALWGLLASCSAGAGWAEERVVDQIVAVVNGKPITQSELEFEARVALVERGASLAADAKLDDATLRSALELSISQRVANDEADKLQAFAVQPSEVEAAISRLRRQFSNEADFRAFLEREDADLHLLEGVYRRSLRAEKYLNSKVRLKSQVSDAELKRFFDEHRGQFAEGFEASKPMIRQRLMRESYESLVRSEMAQARKNADVRIIATFARAGDSK